MISLTAPIEFLQRNFGSKEHSKTGVYLESSILLSFLAFALAALIYLRETSYGAQLSFWGIVLWQMAIWLDWIPAIRPTYAIAERLARARTNSARVIPLAALAALLVGHFCLMLAITSNFSPLSHLPGTKFGVFPYFFIFFALLDTIFSWHLLVRMARSIEANVEPVSDRRMPITVRVDRHDVFLDPDSIRWIASEDYCARIHTDQANYLVRHSLKALLAELPDEEFVQVHRSSIVNVQKIVKANGKHVVLDDGTRCAMSRAGRRRLLDRV